jgi:uridine kinase
VVIEGLFVSRPELADLVDVTVLVATDAAARERRQLERADATPDWLMRWDAAERWYFDNVRPPASFDVTITGVG